jgi:FkbM family methyltransferase
MSIPVYNHAVKKKLQKLNMILRDEGLIAALSYTVNFFLAKTGWFRDKPYFGRMIEKNNNIATLNGCRFNLDSPLITTAIKSRFVLGRYEREERDAVRRFLNPSLPVIELGASLGIVSCVTNKKLQHSEKHVVVEANPELIPLLDRNRQLNDCKFIIENKALSYDARETTFYVHERFLSGSAQRATAKPITVPSTTLADILERHHFDRINLICDIEGGEVEMIIKEKDLLATRVEQIIIEVHPSIVGVDAVTQLRKNLESAGFKKKRTGTYSGIYNSVWLFENTKFIS